MIAKRGEAECYLSTEAMDPESKEHLSMVKQATEIDNMLGVGLHGDGVPSNFWYKTEAFSLNLPGAPSKWQHMRILLVCFYHC